MLQAVPVSGTNTATPFIAGGFGVLAALTGGLYWRRTKGLRGINAR